MTDHFDSIAIHAWLVERGLAGDSPDDLFDGFCRRLAAAPLALARGHVSVSLLHPALRAFGMTWHADDHHLANETFARSEEASAAWRESPLNRMISTGKSVMRRRLAGSGAVTDYPVLREFAAQGLTDWIAFLHDFDPRRPADPERAIGMISSWATARPGGFTAEDLALLSQLIGTFALAMKGAATLKIARAVLSTYVGSDAADHVLAGDITRGSLSRISAALLFCDLRGFTAAAERVAAGPLLAYLNHAFDAVGGPIARQGGQILKFLGDGLLAIFPDSGAPQSACRRALAAAREGLSAMATLNAEQRQLGALALDLDIALHHGEALYGNVGTTERLDFTIIGPSVNMAARLEALCDKLDCRLILSDDFAATHGSDPAAAFRALGRHQLRGIAEPRDIFTLAEGLAS